MQARGCRKGLPDDHRVGKGSEVRLDDAGQSQEPAKQVARGEQVREVDS